jgi:hypothetical protein
MSWLYSRVLVEEYLGDTSLDGEQSAPLNGNPIQQAYCAPDKMTAFSRLSRFGMTYKPLMETRGEELLMSYLAAFHAKTLAPQEKAQELMENEAGCGEKWRGSFVKYDPDSSLWRTHQCSLLGDLDEFLETWPQWGLMRDGECWEQQMLAQTIRGTESGLSQKWATPAAYEDRTTVDQFQQRMKTQKRTVEGAELSMQVRMNIAGLWPTPTAYMSKETNAPSEHNRNTPTLTAQVNWPTPRTAGMCGGTGSWDLLKKNTTIEEARAMGAGNGGKLNPTWVEWLMGWPLEWTDLKPLAMDKSHCVQQQPSDY